MVAHEKRNSAQLFCAVPTRNDLALSSLLFPAQPTQKLGYPREVSGQFSLGFFLRSRRNRAIEKNTTNGTSIITRAAVVILGWYVSMLI